MFHFILFYLVLNYSQINCEGLSFIGRNNYDVNMQVQTKTGLIQGHKLSTLDGRPYYAFEGIPYAQPPLNNLRFRGPKKLSSWKGVLDATREPPKCIEFKIRNRYNISGQEDCLYLNVYTPTKPRETYLPKPVIVLIFGGAFLEGVRRSDLGPDFFLQEDVMVVTFNYRIGLFGFLSTDDVNAYGNWGLKDQLFVLKWVRTNIRNFGGDPNRVTLLGQSAGAVSVLYHMQSPRSQGLFHRAIAQSGSSLSSFALQRNVVERAFDVGLSVGLPDYMTDTKYLMDYLRKENVERLKMSFQQTALLGMVSSFLRHLPYSPNVERNHPMAFIKEKSYESLSAGNFAKVPLLIGLNSNEGVFISNYMQKLQLLLYLYEWSPGLMGKNIFDLPDPNRNREVGLKIRGKYFPNDIDPYRKSEIAKFLSMDEFIRPILKTVELMSKYIPVYLYHFNYAGDLGLKGTQNYVNDYEIYPPTRDFGGACHLEELWYMWRYNGINITTINNDDKVIMQRMVKMWTNFAKSGHPTPVQDTSLGIQWPAANQQNNYSYLEINKRLAVKDNLYRDDMDFWNHLYMQYKPRPYDTY